MLFQIIWHNLTKFSSEDYLWPDFVLSIEGAQKESRESREQGKNEHISLFGTQCICDTSRRTTWKIHFTMGHSKSGASSGVKAKEEETAD
jgi:hypothetical protein